MKFRELFYISLNSSVGRVASRRNTFIFHYAQDNGWGTVFHKHNFSLYNVLLFLFFFFISYETMFRFSFDISTCSILDAWHFMVLMHKIR